MDEFWLGDEQWARLQPLLPNKARGVARVDEEAGGTGVITIPTPQSTTER